VTEIVAVDIGGTHARFAFAEVGGGRVLSLGEAVTLKTADYPGLESAWAEFGRRARRPLPSAASIAVAGPVEGEALKLTNSSWVIRPASLREAFGVERCTLINDFGAVAHAVAQLGEEHFAHLAGPERDLPEEGVITVLGPGTGLGVAQLLRAGGRAYVVPTEGGHIDFAPLDAVEDRMLARLRSIYGRVSIERIASGPGLFNIYRALADLEAAAPAFSDEKALWEAAMAGADGVAAAALERFFLTLGAAAGDIALAQGAEAVVIAGGLGQRLAGHLPKSGFHQRFLAKGRFTGRMQDMPVKMITHPQPGLFGAAAAFAAQHGS
jgi:glucokinase